MKLDKHIKHWANLVKESDENTDQILEDSDSFSKQMDEFIEQWDKVPNAFHQEEFDSIKDSATKYIINHEKEADEYILNYTNEFYNKIASDHLSWKEYIDYAKEKGYALGSLYGNYLAKKGFAGGRLKELFDYSHTLGGHSWEEFDKIRPQVGDARIHLPKLTSRELSQLKRTVHEKGEQIEDVKKEQIHEVSDVDVDQETWKDDMGRSDDRLYNEYLKGISKKHTDLMNKIQKMSMEQFSPVFVFLLDMIENSFDSEAEFKQMLKDKFQNLFRDYKFAGIEKEIIDTIAHNIGETHYQNVERDVNKELD